MSVSFIVFKHWNVISVPPSALAITSLSYRCPLVGPRYRSPLIGPHFTSLSPLLSELSGWLSCSAAALSLALIIAVLWLALTITSPLSERSHWPSLSERSHWPSLSPHYYRSVPIGPHYLLTSPSVSCCSHNYMLFFDANAIWITIIKIFKEDKLQLEK